MLEDIGDPDRRPVHHRRPRHQAGERHARQTRARAKKVVVTKEETTIIEGARHAGGGQGPHRSDSQARSRTPTRNYDKEKLQERLAKLAGGVAVIKVGAATETELKEKKHRFEDALSATRAAVEEGIVAGGGATLVSAHRRARRRRRSAGDEKIGVDIVRKALEEPLRQIAENAGLEGCVVVEKVRNLPDGQGLNAATGEYVDMVTAGIVDPAKVTRSALQNAASIAGDDPLDEVPDRREAREDQAARAMPTTMTTTITKSQARIIARQRPFRTFGRGVFGLW